MSEVLSHHNRTEFEIYVYSYCDYNKEDKIQNHIVKSVDNYKHLNNVSDEQIAEIVKLDKIDASDEYFKAKKINNHEITNNITKI